MREVRSHFLDDVRISGILTDDDVHDDPPQALLLIILRAAIETRGPRSCWSATVVACSKSSTPRPSTPRVRDSGHCRAESCSKSRYWGRCCSLFGPAAHFFDWLGVV
jgi:hypothetical protein